MTIFLLISIPILLIIFLQFFMIGKYLTVAQNMFVNNAFIAWSLGALIYFGILFICFFPLIWFHLNIYYFLAVFFTKDVITIWILISRKKSYLTNIPLKELTWIIVVSIALPFIFNYGISKYTQPIMATKNSAFEIWFIFQDVLRKFSLIKLNFLHNWTLAIIASSVIFSIVTGILIELSNRRKWTWIALGFLATLSMLTLLSFQLFLADSIEIYLILLAFIIAIRIITFSRRRYGFIFGTISLVSYSFDTRTFMVMSALAFITLMIYTYLEKPKIAMFWVQLVAPLLILGSLWFYDISRILILIPFAISFVLYFLTFIITNAPAWKIVNKIIIKLKIVLPTSLILSIFTLAIFYIQKDKINLLKLVTLNSSLFTNPNNNVIYNYLQLIIYSLVGCILLIYIAFIVINSRKIIKLKIALAMVFLVILVIYNPLGNGLVKAWNLQEQFSYFKILTSGPLLLTFWITAWDKAEKRLFS